MTVFPAAQWAEQNTDRLGVQLPLELAKVKAVKVFWAKASTIMVLLKTGGFSYLLDIKELRHKSVLDDSNVNLT